MEVVNRFALIVRPKQRFLEWANALDESPRLTTESLPGLTEVHLVEATFEAPDREALIDEYADEMWEQFLFGWSTDEDTWPRNRTAHTFRDWFDVTVVDCVFDADADAEWNGIDAGVEDAVENALTQCAWCGAQIDDEQDVATLFMTLAENDPLKVGENEVILVPVSGRDRRAVVAQRGSDMAREGRDLAFTMCSERCAKAMKNLLERERSAQLS